MTTAETSILRLGTAEVELCSIGEAEVFLSYPASLDEWLSAGERRTLEGLRTPKRKRDWLSARVAAKRVVGRRLRALGHPTPSADIEIASHESREPFVADEEGDPDESLPVSLSHAGDYGACALGAPGTRVGMDLERIEPRDPAWRELMADDSELEPDSLGSPEALTRLWTAKEAVLKLLGVGLSVDLRGVMLRADGGVQLAGAALERWKSLGAPELELHFARYHDCCLTVSTSRR
ncbi:MAG: 4'-phosphopantetheinyl transferase superfamily protein [Elusimicrobia bacterium]|nr:4'-phosphopantetheinyl transferase superfamily protein [Elusimicrobiota bacterium]